MQYRSKFQLSSLASNKICCRKSLCVNCQRQLYFPSRVNVINGHSKIEVYFHRSGFVWCHFPNPTESFHTRFLGPNADSRTSSICLLSCYWYPLWVSPNKITLFCRSSSSLTNVFKAAFDFLYFVLWIYLNFSFLFSRSSSCCFATSPWFEMWSFFIFSIVDAANIATFIQSSKTVSNKKKENWHFYLLHLIILLIIFI